MKAQITVTLDNAAFSEDSGTELARILKGLACDLEGREMSPGEVHTLRDYNGNRVGSFAVSAE